MGERATETNTSHSREVFLQHSPQPIPIVLGTVVELYLDCLEVLAERLAEFSNSTIGLVSAAQHTLSWVSLKLLLGNLQHFYLRIISRIYDGTALLVPVMACCGSSSRSVLQGSSSSDTGIS